MQLFDLIGVIFTILLLPKFGIWINVVYDLESYETKKKNRSHWTWFAHLVWFVVFIDCYILLLLFRIMEFAWNLLFVKKEKIVKEDNINKYDESLWFEVKSPY